MTEIVIARAVIAFVTALVEANDARQRGEEPTAEQLEAETLARKLSRDRLNDAIDKKLGEPQ